MGDSDDNKQIPLVPSWQQAASSETDDPAATTESTLDQARRFLQEDTVKDSSRDKKVEFLKSKGLDEADITKLLDEDAEIPAVAAQPAPSQPAPSQLPTTTPSPTEYAPFAPPEPTTKPDQPPIVTYPEFLTAPLKPPPLITATGLLNALTAIAAASTLVYGATKHLISPMVTTLTDARIDLHAKANTHLTSLVDKLEQAVSEIPAGYHTHTSKKLLDGGDDASASSSTYDDPTELFHRDVGVQTSAPPSPTLPSYLTANTNTTTAARTAHQAYRLTQLATKLRALSSDVVQQSEELAATKGELEAFGSDLHTLTYPPESFGAGSTYLYGSAAAASKHEPDDEIRRVKMSIRGVKGVLLSTRSFPATTR